MEMRVQFSRYLSAVELPDGRIFRHLLSATGGGELYHLWGFVPLGTKEWAGWGDAGYARTVNPSCLVAISNEDLAEIIRQADSGEKPETHSTAWWYFDHVPYWGGVNDGNRVVARHGERPAVADRALAVYLAASEAANAVEA